MTKTTDIAVPQTTAIALASPSALADIASNIAMEPLRAADLDRIKVPGGGGTAWEVQTLDGIKHVPLLRGIVLASKMGRAYWEDEFSGESNPPDCMSLNGLTGEGKPGGNCEACPFNEYESAKKGKGKACKEQRTIMALLEGDLLPTVLRVPPSSLKAWRSYMMRVSKGGKRVQHVITDMSLNKAKSSDGISYAEIVFTSAGVLAEEEVAAIESYISSVASSLEAAHADVVAEQPSESGANPFAG